MSKEFVLGTLNHYDWVQIGGAITHPENGKRVDMGEAVKQEMGIDGNLTIYPISGYGSPDLLRQVMDMEKPDAILHYTDPRFWGWLYQMEHEVRQEIPIFYYNIWDDWPAPQYNENFYECSDLIMNISKQTYAIVNEVSKNKPRNDWDCTYLPHGVSKKFYPISKFDDEYKKVEATKNRLTDEDVEFVLFYNNRNIRRKMTSDVILAYKTFCDKLTPEEAKKVCLLMHTQPVDENGTDLPEVARVVCPDYKVYFSNRKLEPHELNHLFNVADVTINIASNEGFGLGTCESLMAGTPIIVNVTGGLQDQCGFRLKKYNSDKTGFTHEFLTHKDYTEIQSLHDWRKWENNNDLTHGDWVKPVWPRTRALQGSPVTPYIFDDRADWVDVSDRINDWYVMDKKERETCGLKGREFVMTEEIGMSGEQMSKNFIKDMDKAFEMWKPRKRYSIFKA
jgi:glycosyltransferase involved in cell wall biosynthesis